MCVCRAVEILFSPLLLDIVLDRLVASKQLEEENREKVRRALLQRHKHHHTKESHIRSPFSELTHHGSYSKRAESVDGAMNGGGNSHGNFLNWLGRQNSASSVANGHRESNTSLPGSLGYRRQSSLASTNDSETSLPRKASDAVGNVLNVPGLTGAKRGSDAHLPKVSGYKGGQQ